MTATLRAAALVLVSTLGLPSNASAGHHGWVINEIFSNGAGTVQFVELLGTTANEEGVVGFSVDTLGTAPSGPIPLTQISLPAVDPNTAGRYYLVATAGYASLAGVQGATLPDATLPNNFLQLGADTVRYDGTTDTLSYTGGQLPTDGIDSLDLENPGGTVNTPRSWADPTNTGSIDASVPASPIPLLPRGTAWIMGVLVLAIGAVELLRRARARAS